MLVSIQTIIYCSTPELNSAGHNAEGPSLHFTTWHCRPIKLSILNKHSNNFIFLSDGDPGMSIVSSGAVKTVANVSRRNNNSKDKHLWSDSILPDRPPSLLRSLSENNKQPRGSSLMSDNIIQTLDTLSLSHDQYVQSR